MQNKNQNVESRFFSSLIMLSASIIILFVVFTKLSPEIEDSNTAQVQIVKKRPIRANSKSTFKKITYKNINNSQNLKQEEKHNKENLEISSSASKELRDLHEKLANARDLIDGGNPNEALEILNDILEKNPNDINTLTEMGMLQLIDFRNSDAAKDFFERAVNIESDNKLVLSELVGIYEDSNSLEQGLEFLKGLQNSEDNGTLALAIGQVMVSLGRDKEALGYLEKAAAFEGQADFVLTDLADAYSVSGNPEKALETYQKAIEREKLRQEEMASNGHTTALGDERLSLLEMDYTRELIRQGKLDEAEDVISKIKARSTEEDGSISALIEHLNKKRAG